jgi:hypothetical protein
VAAPAFQANLENEFSCCCGDVSGNPHSLNNCRICANFFNFREL